MFNKTLALVAAIVFGSAVLAQAAPKGQVPPPDAEKAWMDRASQNSGECCGGN